MFKIVTVWLAMLAAIVMLGLLREKVTALRWGELRAHQLGTILACVAVVGVVWLFLPWFKLRSDAEALGLGAIWLGMALAFEFGVFGLVRGVPWSQLLADYNLAAGRLLPVLWLTVLLSAVVGKWLRGG